MRFWRWHYRIVSLWYMRASAYPDNPFVVYSRFRDMPIRKLALCWAILVYGYAPFWIPLALAVWYLARHLTVAVGWR